MSWTIWIVWLIAATAGVRLNEVLYDPPGTDTDAEFVELFNTSDETVGLSGWYLVFVNGADPSRPSVVWEATDVDRIEPRGFFVVGGEFVQPRQATARLSLQNGPDALQLWRGDTMADALAWGEAEGLGEGRPASDVTGTSLGRVPDGVDTDDNALDWFTLPQPNPGERNAPPDRFHITLLGVDPPWRIAPGPFQVRLRVVAVGSGSRQKSVLQWRVTDRLLREDILSAARGDTLELANSVALERGRHELRVFTVEGEPDSLGVALQVGLGAVMLSEVLARPPSGEPEWVELRSLRDVAMDLSGWSLADAARSPRSLPRDARLGSAGFGVVSQDCARLELPSTVHCWELEGGWIPLNNTGADGQWADEVLLLDGQGAVLDWAPYDDRLQPGTGVSMERSLLAGGESAAWFASPGEPTPGRTNLTGGAVVPERGLEVSPNPFSPDGDGLRDVLHVVLLRERETTTVLAEVFDLAGERVRGLGEREGPGLVQWIWDGRDERERPVAMGAYVILVRAVDSPTTWRALVALGRRS